MAEKTVAKSWADEEDDDDAPPGFGEAGAPSDAAAAASAAAAAALKGLKVASGSKEEASAGRETKNDAEEGVIDQPDISIKTGQLNDVPDGSEHEIKSVSWDSDVQPERSMQIHFGGVLRTMKSFFLKAKSCVNQLVAQDFPLPHSAIYVQVIANDTPYTSAKTFEELNLSEPLLRGLYSEMKFERPSKIQAVTLPMILNPPHANLIAQVGRHACSQHTAQSQ